MIPFRNALSLVLLTLASLSLPATALAQPRPSTAGKGVHVLPALAMPGLDRTRVVRIYLPPGYDATTRRYPVLYMHDGQNLFDDATSFAGEWAVDEILDRLARTEGLSLIVVGIDNGQDKRLNELSPWTNPKYGPAEGEQYARFLVETVKPYVDAHYRTLSDRQHTGVMGSSMGGLMSDYLIHRYPQVFSRAGVFSPSYWYAGDAVFAYAVAHPLPSGSRLYLYAGGKEGEESVIQNLDRMAALLEQQRRWRSHLRRSVNPDAQHNEAAWRAEFPAAVRWLFGR